MRPGALVVLIGLLLPAACFGADAPEGWFAFQMPALGSEGTLVDMSWLSPEPAGAAGFVRIEGGRFVDGHGKRLRLLGTNCTFAGAFPPKDAAPRVAARMRAFGMNVVRFHHIDTHTAPRGLWNKDRRTLDPAQLDILDWFIHQLIQHGIYVNLNLHVSRTYEPVINSLSRAFRYGKGLDNFYPRYIRMQRRYAKMLLTHRNPYTKHTYAQEPGLLCVEINNENSILTRSPQSLAELPDPFGGELTRQWRAWTKRHYADTRALAAAWNELDEPLGRELLTNGPFAEGPKAWALEAPKPAKGSIRGVPDGPQPGMAAVRCELTALGRRSWDFQVHQVGLSLQDGQSYTASFWAKADPPRRLSFGVRMAAPPWNFVGLRTNVPLTKDWQRRQFTFKCMGPKPKLTRLSFNFGNVLGACWVASVSLRPGGYIGMPKGQSIEAHNITLPGAGASPAMQVDFRRFLIDTERAYVQGMVRYIKDTLRVKAHVADTQASYGGVAGVHREASLSDFVDIHAYWQHPHFPGKPWDRSNWRIRNTPMVADAAGGTLARLALHRVPGKPFTVSEYDHPAPSHYSAEMFPMLAAFAGWQDWDGLYQFCYGGSSNNWQPDRITSYFGLAPHPGKMLFLPAAVVMFRAYAVAPAAEVATLRVPQDKIAGLLASGQADVRGMWQRAGFEPFSAVHRRTAVRFTTGGEVAVSEKTGDIEPAPGPICWDGSDPQRASFAVNAPAVRAAVGFIAGRSLDLGDVRIAAAPSGSRWASIALAALDAKPIAESKRLLLVAAGRVENTGMGWNEDHTTVGRQWGKVPVIAEGIAATVELPGRTLRVSSLHGTGKRKADVPVTTAEAGRVAIEIGPQHQTLWYLIER